MNNLNKKKQKFLARVAHILKEKALQNYLADGYFQIVADNQCLLTGEIAFIKGELNEIDIQLNSGTQSTKGSPKRYMYFQILWQADGTETCVKQEIDIEDIVEYSLIQSMPRARILSSLPIKMDDLKDVDDELSAKVYISIPLADSKKNLSVNLNLSDCSSEDFESYQNPTEQLLFEINMESFAGT